MTEKALLPGDNRTYGMERTSESEDLVESRNRLWQKWKTIVKLCRVRIDGRLGLNPQPSKPTISVKIRVKLNFFPGRVKFFQGGRILIFFPEIVKYRKLYYVLNCYLAVNCPKPTPSPILALFQRGSTTAPGGSNPPTPSRQFLPWLKYRPNW